MARKNGLWPPSSSPMARSPRSHSPDPGRSTLMTSAPRSPRNWVAHGPIIIWVKSRTRTPSSAIAIRSPPRPGGVHGGQHPVRVAAPAQVAVDQLAGRLLEGQEAVVAGPQHGRVQGGQSVAEEAAGGRVDRLVGPGRAVPRLAAGLEVE